MKKNNFALLLDPAPGGSGGGGAPTPEPTITVAASNELINKARQEEKNKLYADIQKLQDKLKEAEGQLATANQTITSQTATIKKHEDTIAAFNASGGDVSKLVEEVAAKIGKQKDEHYARQIAEIQGRLQTVEGESNSLKLERYKAEAVRRAGGEDVLIMAMVGGNSTEEIDASIVASHEAFKQTYKRSTGKDFVLGSTTLNDGNGNGQQPPQNPGAGAPPRLAPPAPVVPPGAPGGTGDSGLLSTKSMSLKDYGSQRESLMRATDGRYKGRQ